MNQFKLKVRNTQGKQFLVTVNSNTLEEAKALIRKKGFEIVTETSQKLKESNDAALEFSHTVKPIRSSRSALSANSTKKVINEGKKDKRNRRNRKPTLVSSGKNNYLVFCLLGVAALIILALLFTKGGSKRSLVPENGWYQYTAKESGFQVFLPNSMRMETKSVNDQNFYICTDKDRDYMIVFTKYDFISGLTSYSEKTSKTVLDTLVSITIKEMKGRVKSKKETKVHGFNAIDVICQADDLSYARVMNILTPKGSYSIGIACLNPSAVDDQKTNTFINSIIFN